MGIDQLFAFEHKGKTVLDVQAENRNKDIFKEALKFEELVSELHKSF